MDARYINRIPRLRVGSFNVVRSARFAWPVSSGAIFNELGMPCARSVNGSAEKTKGAIPGRDQLCKGEKLIRQGHPISILNETEFLGLVGL